MLQLNVFELGFLRTASACRCGKRAERLAVLSWQNHESATPMCAGCVDELHNFITYPEPRVRAVAS